MTSFTPLAYVATSPLPDLLFEYLYSTGEEYSDDAPNWHCMMVWLPQPAMPAAKSQ